jgi:hypothetical protein
MRLVGCEEFLPLGRVHGDQIDDVSTQLGNGGVPRRRRGSNDDLRRHRTVTDCTLTGDYAGTRARTGSCTGARTSAHPDANAHTDSNPDADSAAVAVQWRGTAGHNLTEPSPVQQFADPELHVGQYLDVYPDFGQRGKRGDHSQRSHGLLRRALFSTRSGLGIVIPAGSKTTLTTRFCSANSFEHHTRTDFTGSDTRNNRINYRGPEVTLSKK